MLYSSESGVQRKASQIKSINLTSDGKIYCKVDFGLGIDLDRQRKDEKKAEGKCLNKFSIWKWRCGIRFADRGSVTNLTFVSPGVFGLSVFYL